MTARHFTAAVLLLFVAACHKDEEKETRETLRSWRNTIELVQSQRERHNVPAVYAKQVGKHAVDQLSKELQKPHSREIREEAERVIALAGHLREAQT